MLEHFLTQVGFGSVDISHILTSGSACIGILRRELHCCVRIEKQFNLGFCFARFGVRKPPKNHSNRSPKLQTNLTSGWNLTEPKICLLEPSARAELTIRSSGFIFLGQIWTRVLISMVHFFAAFKLRVVLFSTPNPWFSLSLISLFFSFTSIAKTLVFLSTQTLNLLI